MRSVSRPPSVTTGLCDSCGNEPFFMIYLRVFQTAWSVCSRPSSLVQVRYAEGWSCHARADPGCRRTTGDRPGLPGDVGRPGDRRVRYVEGVLLPSLQLE